jgi:hypothetical protein
MRSRPRNYSDGLFNSTFIRITCLFELIPSCTNSLHSEGFGNVDLFVLRPNSFSHPGSALSAYSNLNCFIFLGQKGGGTVPLVIGGGNRNARRKPTTCRKSLTNFISHTVGSSTPCLNGVRTHNVSGDRY